MASRNQKFSVPSAHTQNLFQVARAFNMTPTQCLARLLDEAMPDAERILTRSRPVCRHADN
jgi:hypothetical protein